MKIPNPQPQESAKTEEAAQIMHHALMRGSAQPRSWWTRQTTSGLTQFRTSCLRFACCLVILVCCLSASAQYAITWHTIDGGGGTSTGGVYAVSGTIGQPEAGPTMTGGAYSLTGGFWVLPVAVQNPDAPTLTIVPAGLGQARISWPPTIARFVLQERESLSTGTWTDSPSGMNNPALVPATLPARFYRLFKP